MPFTAIANTDLDTDSPLSEADLMSPLRDRDLWNWEEATAAGVGPSATGLSTALGSHSHDGTAGQGNPIPEDGIADGAVFDADMIGDDEISAGKIAANTMVESDLATASVTAAKMAGAMGWQINPASPTSYDTAQSPGAGDAVFLGDTISVANPKGALGVLCSYKEGASGIVEGFCSEQTASTITFRIRLYALHAGVTPASGSWNIDCYIM